MSRSPSALVDVWLICFAQPCDWGVGDFRKECYGFLQRCRNIITISQWWIVCLFPNRWLEWVVYISTPANLQGKMRNWESLPGACHIEIGWPCEDVAWIGSTGLGWYSCLLLLNDALHWWDDTYPTLITLDGPSYCVTYWGFTSRVFQSRMSDLFKSPIWTQQKPD